MTSDLRRRAAVPAAVFALALAVTSCAGGGGAVLGPRPAGEPATAAPTTATAPTSAPATTVPATTVPTTVTTVAVPPTTSDPQIGPPRWAPAYQTQGGVADHAALTGRPLAEGVDPGAPVLAVKIDNHPRARPQTGLEDADVVFEENVEELTRFVALFHRQRPATVGPVRSARTSDLPILAALNRPVLAWSGGNPYVERSVDQAQEAGILVDRSHPGHPGCYRRSRDRSAPHNLYGDPACLLGDAGGGPARPLWTFGPIPAGMATTTSVALAVAMDGVEVSWTWDPTGARYVRSQGGRDHVAASGARIGAENVVVMTVPYVRSAADHRSPEAVTVGRGPVVVHRDGVAVAGTWERADLISPFTFLDPTGRVIPLAPGVTFVELARG